MLLLWLCWSATVFPSGCRGHLVAARMLNVRTRRLVKGNRHRVATAVIARSVLPSSLRSGWRLLGRSRQRARDAACGARPPSCSMSMRVQGRATASLASKSLSAPCCPAFTARWKWRRRRGAPVPTRRAAKGVQSCVGTARRYTGSVCARGAGRAAGALGASRAAGLCPRRVRGRPGSATRATRLASARRVRK